MAVLACVIDGAERCGLSVAELVDDAAKRGYRQALKLIAGRLNGAPIWSDRHCPLHKAHEVSVVVEGVGYAVAYLMRPRELDREIAGDRCARALFRSYVEAMREREVSAAAALAEHLAAGGDRGDIDPATAAPVAPLPVNGLRDIFTGETRIPPAYVPSGAGVPQRRLF